MAISGLFFMAFAIWLIKRNYGAAAAHILKAY